MGTGAGTRYSLPLQLPRRQLPLHSLPPWARRRSERELQLSRDFGRGLANFSEFLFRAFPGRRGGRRVRDGDIGLLPGVRRRPAPLPSLRSLGLAPALPPALPAWPAREFAAAVSGVAVAGAAVRGWYQDGEERALPRLGARAGVLRSGQRSLTFLGLAPGWGHREQPSDPSEWLVRCAPLGSFSGIRCLRPGPSPLRNETCLPGRRKAMTVSWLG